MNLEKFVVWSCSEYDSKSKSVHWSFNRSIFNAFARWAETSRPTTYFQLVPTRSPSWSRHPLKVGETLLLLLHPKGSSLFSGCTNRSKGLLSGLHTLSKGIGPDVEARYFCGATNNRLNFKAELMTVLTNVCCKRLGLSS